ncbi:hypothetical protein D6D54_01675 [Spiroplasma poulsonii]|uniref:Uncharacterized protein n=1 Tax=Spiroplasma poulsonii TaxID=2138 RepID=A0A3S0SFL1_9MOLU|nr:hypothetical protein D6D54_01675 [Spiroplasma poulsonii]
MSFFWSKKFWLFLAFNLCHCFPLPIQLKLHCKYYNIKK